MPSAKLLGTTNCYKIKLPAVGYRLVYEVRDVELGVSVIAVVRPYSFLPAQLLDSC